MQRYFVHIDNGNILFDESDIHHICHVLRMHLDEQIEVVDQGKLYLAKLISFNPLKAEIIKEIEGSVELESEVNICFALSKGDKNEFVIQKATELGANKIVLVATKRCINKTDEKDFAKKLIRYQKIAKEAAEQCHRLVVPEIEYKKSIKDVDIKDINLVAYEKEAGDTTDSFNRIKKGQSINILIGPEGGFDEEEISLLKKMNYQVISLGKRILRCETAAVYALSVISYLLER